MLYGTDDAREGIAAFVAKRKPRFGGALTRWGGSTYGRVRAG